MDGIEKVIIEAGGILKEEYGHSLKFSRKGKSGLLSEVDVEIERIIVGQLCVLFPGDGIYSEEAGETKGNTGRRWILDPMDGTTNFIFGIPHFCISLCLERDGKIVEAHVYNPIPGEYYMTKAGERKSFLNGNEIHVSETDRVENALVVFGFSADHENISAYHRDWGKLFDGCGKGLGMLSPALNICNVARGRIDCFLDLGSSMEGHAGAALILKRAGGSVSNYDSTSWDFEKSGVIASNAHLMPVLRGLKNG